MGSSPRVRGTQCYGQPSPQSTGIIPACAGNTSQGWNRRYPERDHPRVCGEHTLTEAGDRISQGSSPRVRGTPPTREEKLGENGIIPACAGNTIGV